MPKVAVGIITRDRPVMLEVLLDSLLRLTTLPDLVIVVENAPIKSLDDLVARFCSKGLCLVHENEPKVGIPSARNKVLEAALREACDLLAFVDDDETVQPDWLAELVSEVRTRELDMVAGPVRILPCEPSAPWLARLVWRSIDDRRSKREARADRLRADGRDYLKWLNTGNLLIRMGFVAKSGVRFDESAALSGGSDTRFYFAAVAAGAKTGWCPTAIAYEHIPTSRLSLRYQFERARDQELSLFWARLATDRRPKRLRILASVPLKVLSGCGHLAAVPFTGGLSLVKSARMFGVASGRFRTLFKAESRHYERVHGD